MRINPLPYPPALQRAICVLSSITHSVNYRWWAFAAVAIGTFSSVVDHGSVTIALPTIAGHFETDIPSVQWVVIGFALTISALLLPMGRLADLAGLKKVYIWGGLVFILGAVVAGSATSLPVLVAARILQGCGAAMTQGTGMAIITGAFPASERGKAIGLMMTTVGAGAIFGPALGGLLVDLMGWRWVFYANVPLVAMGLVLGLAVLDGSHEGQHGPHRGRGFDWLGAALSTGILLLFLLTITSGHRTGWTSAPILAAMACLVAFLAAFIWWELRCASPMLELRFFQKRTFSFGISAAFFTFLGSSAVLFLTPFYLQRVLGYSPQEAGLVVVPGAICMSILGPLSGRLSDRYGWRPFTVGGLLLSATGLLLLSRVTAESSLLLVLPALMLQSCGMGVFYSPNSSSILSTVERESYGVVSAFVNLVRNAGNVTSVAVATAIVTATMGAMGFEPSLHAVQGGGASAVGQAFTLGLRNAYLVMAGLLLLAMTLSAFRFERVTGLEPVPASGGAGDGS
jgi:EmrB/QacA subfamily drug resistance transporter